MGMYMILSSLCLPLHSSIPWSSKRWADSAAESDSMTRIWIVLVGFAAPALVMWSRVRLGVHTPAQTLAGAALGVAKACLWFIAWNGTVLVFGSSFASDEAWFRFTLRNGLKNTVGAPMDAVIGETEARLFRLLGH